MELYAAVASVSVRIGATSARMSEPPDHSRPRTAAATTMTEIESAITTRFVGWIPRVVRVLPPMTSFLRASGHPPQAQRLVMLGPEGRIGEVGGGGPSRDPAG